jgi:hypothetical protein
MTIAEQVAQKLHAVTAAEENRPRDLIDIYLCVTRLPPDDGELHDACVKTFSERDTHAWPPTLQVRDGWSVQLTEIIATSELDLTVDEVFDGVRNLVGKLAALR